MRIAYISYEYPPDISAGGIATYTLQAAKLMKYRGHDVEVFCGSFERNISEMYDNVLTHRIKISDVIDFREKIVPIFKERHDFKKFEIFESPEINGNGYNIKIAFPEVPMTVKMHTPAVLQIRIFNTYTGFFAKLRFFLGALLRRKFDLGYWSKHDKNQNNDIDFQICELAERISSPSVSLKKWAIDFWKIETEKIDLLPYPYIAEDTFLNINLESNFKTITFFGKLNVHKGMVAYTKVIPKVLEKYPDYKFIIIGKDGNSHKKGISMKNFMLMKLKKHINSIEFIENVSLDKIPEILQKTDICVFPSIWDNFPLVCLESMSAGRAIVGSKEGGMLDMLKNTNAGYLVNPKNIREIAQAINFFIENPEKRFEYGARARKRIFDEYNSEKIGKLMEDFYKKIIDKQCE
jgi:glycosyltransferase involved in cell wall biosynthesis